MDLVKSNANQTPSKLLLYYNDELSYAKYWLYSTLIVFGFYGGGLLVALIETKFCLRCQHCINFFNTYILNIKYIPFVAIGLLLLYSILTKRIHQISVDAHSREVKIMYQKLFITHYTISIPFNRFNYQQNFVTDTSDGFDYSYWKLTLYNHTSKIIEIKPIDLGMTNDYFENHILNPLNKIFR